MICETSKQANFNGNKPYGGADVDPYLGRTTDVGSYQPNPWGFYDMHGNVREWCADWYGNYPTGLVTDPSGPVSGSLRVIRGGSWRYDGHHLRSAKRGNGHSPSYRNSYLGFRVGLRQVGK